MATSFIFQRKNSADFGKQHDMMTSLTAMSKTLAATRPHSGATESMVLSYDTYMRDPLGTLVPESPKTENPISWRNLLDFEDYMPSTTLMPSLGHTVSAIPTINMYGLKGAIESLCKEVALSEVPTSPYSGSMDIFLTSPKAVSDAHEVGPSPFRRFRSDPHTVAKTTTLKPPRPKLVRSGSNQGTQVKKPLSPPLFTTNSAGVIRGIQAKAEMTGKPKGMRRSFSAGAVDQEVNRAIMDTKTTAQPLGAGMGTNMVIKKSNSGSGVISSTLIASRAEGPYVKASPAKPPIKAKDSSVKAGAEAGESRKKQKERWDCVLSKKKVDEIIREMKQRKVSQKSMAGILGCCQQDISCLLRGLQCKNREALERHLLRWLQTTNKGHGSPVKGTVATAKAGISSVVVGSTKAVTAPVTAKVRVKQKTMLGLAMKTYPPTKQAVVQQKRDTQEKQKVDKMFRGQNALQKRVIIAGP